MGVQLMPSSCLPPHPPTTLIHPALLLAGLAPALAASAAQELLHSAVVMEALTTLLLLGADANARAGLAKGTQALLDYLDGSDSLAARCMVLLC